MDLVEHKYSHTFRMLGLVLARQRRWDKINNMENTLNLRERKDYLSVFTLGKKNTLRSTIFTQKGVQRAGTHDIQHILVDVRQKAACWCTLLNKAEEQ